MEEIDLLKLSKKERKKLKKELDKQNQLQGKKQKNFMKWGIIVVVILIFGAGGFWFFKELTKPVPGKYVEDLGRDHVPKKEWEEFKHNSNPASSGPHDAEWIKKGIYTKSSLDLGKGYLIHSLEHGYIQIHYNCLSPKTSTSMNDKEWESKECKNLITQLTNIVKEKTDWKMILLPNPTIDTKVSVVAWTRINSMNPEGENGLLNNFQVEEVKRFIDAFRDHGPEKTMEP